jgi:hypothetical protein
MSYGLRVQVLFLLIIRLGVKSFTHGHLVNLVIVLSIPVAMALQSQSPSGRGVRRHPFLLSVYLELKSLADSHIVGIVLDAITLVLVPQDATILVMALRTLTILEVALQNVIGVELEIQGTTVAVGSTLWNKSPRDMSVSTGHSPTPVPRCESGSPPVSSAIRREGPTDTTLPLTRRLGTPSPSISIIQPETLETRTTPSSSSQQRRNNIRRGYMTRIATAATLVGVYQLIRTISVCFLKFWHKLRVMN